MDHQLSANQHRSRVSVIPGTLIILLLFAIAPAVLMLFSPLLPTQWFIVSMMATVGIFLVILLRNNQNLNIWFLAFSLCLNLDINLQFQTRPYFTSSFGYSVTIPFIALILLYLHLFWKVFMKGQRFKLSGIVIVPLTIYVVICFTSLNQTPDPKFARFELFRLIQSIMLFLYIALFIRTRKQIMLVCKALAFAVLIQGLLASLQFVTGSYLGLGIFGEARELRLELVGLEALSRVVGTQGHPNSLAMLLDVVLPVVIAFALVAKGKYRSVYIFSAVLGVITMVLTMSRGGTLAIGLTIPVLFWVYSKRANKLNILTAMGLIILIVTVILFFAFDNPVKARFFRQNYSSALTRLPMMKVAANMIQDNLLTGVGVNSYTIVAPTYDTTVERISTVFPLPVHNIFLLMLAEIGLIGFTAFIAFVTIVLLKGLKVARGPDLQFSLISIGFSLGIIAFFIHGLVDSTALAKNFPFWLNAGAIVGLWHISGGKKRMNKKLVGSTSPQA